jgi:SPP1 gp7 family putative phage head morphogenesis protein
MPIDDWKPAGRHTLRYQQDLERFVSQYVSELVETEHVSLDEALIRAGAEVIARRMITGLAVTNARSWREAARRSLRGQRIYHALRDELRSPVGTRFHELIEANARLISSLPLRLAEWATDYIAKEQIAGERTEAIRRELASKLPMLTRSKLKLIARTEVSKAETALTRARAERLGLHWYQWANSKDQRVRPGHRLLGDVLVAWSDAPAPEQLVGEKSKLGAYHAGNCPNCRCICLPIVSLDEIRWPARVYGHGRIEWMRRNQFEQWIEIPEAA